jgi:Uma2 family endonuclease
MAAQPLAAPLTSDAFLQIYDEQEDGLRRYELFDGEVVERPVPNIVHDEIKNLLMIALTLHFQRAPGYVARVETTFKLGAGLTFTPDLAVVESGRWKTMREKFATGSPDIAFEVVSSDRADRLQFKIDSYLEHGSHAVCCIYPARKRLAVFTKAQWLEVREGGRLEFPSLLPGFGLPLAAIFEATE